MTSPLGLGPSVQGRDHLHVGTNVTTAQSRSGTCTSSGFPLPPTSPLFCWVLGREPSWVRFPGSPVSGCPAGLGRGKCWGETVGGRGRKGKLESLPPCSKDALAAAAPLLHPAHSNQFLQMKLASAFQKPLLFDLLLFDL